MRSLLQFLSCFVFNHLFPLFRLAFSGFSVGGFGKGPGCGFGTGTFIILKPPHPFNQLLAHGRPSLRVDAILNHENSDSVPIDLPEHLTILHHKRHLFEVLYIVEGILRCGDNVGG